MRMSRSILLAATSVLFLASCDPFDLVEPRPQHRYREYHPPLTHRGPEPRPYEREREASQEDRQMRPNLDGRPVPQRYPVAQRTDNPNQVISPFAPFNVIDVAGYSPGQLVRDPTNNEIFRIP